MSTSEWDEQEQHLLEMFPKCSVTEARSALSIAKGDMEEAVRLIIEGDVQLSPTPSLCVSKPNMVKLDLSLEPSTTEENDSDPNVSCQVCLRMNNIMYYDMQNYCIEYFIGLSVMWGGGRSTSKIAFSRESVLQNTVVHVLTDPAWLGNKLDVVYVEFVSREAKGRLFLHRLMRSLKQIF